MIHHVYANRSNIGDWLSARGIQRLLPGLPFVEHLCDEPFVEETLERLRAAGPEDLVVIGGGGLFMDYFYDFWAGFSRLAADVPFVVWGAGFVDLKDEPSTIPSDVLGPILARARLVSVRDELSRTLLEGSAEVEVAPCPSFNAVDPRPRSGTGILHAANYTTAGATAYEEMVRMAGEFARSTDRVYRETNNIVQRDDERALQALVELYARSDVVVTSRLHGAILAVAVGRPVIAVSGDRKIEDFMIQAGLGDWVLDAGDVGRLPALLGDVERQPSAAAFADSARRRNAAFARRVLAQAFPVLERPHS